METINYSQKLTDYFKDSVDSGRYLITKISIDNNRLELCSTIEVSKGVVNFEYIDFPFDSSTSFKTIDYDSVGDFNQRFTQMLSRTKLRTLLNLSDDEIRDKYGKAFRFKVSILSQTLEPNYKDLTYKITTKIKVGSSHVASFSATYPIPYNVDEEGNVKDSLNLVVD